MQNKLTKIACAIGSIQSKIILTLVYFTVIPVFSFIKKISNRGKGDGRNFWIARDKTLKSIENLKKEW